MLKVSKWAKAIWANGQGPSAKRANCHGLRSNMTKRQGAICRGGKGGSAPSLLVTIPLTEMAEAHYSLPLL